MSTISIIGFIMQVASLAGLALTFSLFAPSVPVIAVQVSAFALMVWARRTFGLRSFHADATPTAGGVVTTGPYRYVRHPIYAAILLFLLAGAVSYPSITSAIFATTAIIGTALRITMEERLMRERYPEYASYAAKTARIVPFVL